MGSEAKTDAVSLCFQGDGQISVVGSQLTMFRVRRGNYLGPVYDQMQTSECQPELFEQRIFRPKVDMLGSGRISSRLAS